MDRYQEISVVEEQYKVRDLDEAIRALRRSINPPWTLKKGTLRVFQDVLEYPIASDHKNMAYFDNQKKKFWSNDARFLYTSLQQFYENIDDRNNLAEIWDQGTKYIGLRYKDILPSGYRIDDASVLSRYTVGGDIISEALDYVTVKNSNSSIKLTLVNSTNLANVSCAFTNISDSSYREKYFFVWIYLASAPSSIDLQFGNDNANYLYKNVTTQFSGQALKANDWNLLAFDLNAASAQGAVSDSAFDYFNLVLHDAPSGVYFLGTTYLRKWELLDYWYYSTFNVKTNSSLIPDQEYLFDANEAYSLDSSIVADTDWADVIQYDGMLSCLSDSKDQSTISLISSKREVAWGKLMEKYPDMQPIIITNRVNFETDYTRERYAKRR